MPHHHQADYLKGLNIAPPLKTSQKNLLQNTGRRWQSHSCFTNTAEIVLIAGSLWGTIQCVGSDY